MNIRQSSFYLRKLASVLSLLIIVIALTILSPYFLTTENLLSIGLQMSVIAIMSIGQVWIIIAGGIDLSVGSILAISGVVSTMLISGGMNMVLASVIGIGIGSFCGFI
ncbi:MAG: ribose ABC transporter permease, partial [bacterium]|nr:ribose ABC transporter permease [bacterium]